MSQTPTGNIATHRTVWLDPRRPLLFIFTGTFIYAILTTLAQIASRNFGSHTYGAFTLVDVSTRLLANTLGGVLVVSLIYWREKLKRRTQSPRAL